MGLVNVAFFCADQKSRRFVVWEIKRGDCHFSGFVVTSMDEFQGFLSPKITTDRRTENRRTYLGLSQHIH